MITYEKYTELSDELVSELPDEFFSELNLGVVALDEIKYHPVAKPGELYIMGEYTRGVQMGCGIILYYGSFSAVYGDLSEEKQIAELRKIIRHEFRHHLESRAGEGTLAAEDEMKLENFLSGRKS